MQRCWKWQFLILLVICHPVFAENESRPELPTLRLLAMVPLAENSLPPYHRGDWEILSAAEMAVDKINRRDDILPGYRLELIPVNTETCNQSLVTEAPVNFVRHVTGGDLSIVGVVGLVCSTVTQAISPLAGRPEIDLLQISAGAISPIFSNEKEYPLLYRMVSSSAVYNDVVLSMMATFQWKRISMVRDATLIQHTTTADNFVAKLDERTELEFVFLGDITSTCPSSPVHTLIRKRARIIYASVTAFEARELLCEMYQKGKHRWPDFVWLFHDLSIEDLILSTEKCDNDTMQTAVEGVFLMRYRLQPNPNTILVSGQTYSEYLMELHNHTNGIQENQHANSLHSSIWAFALALNNSVFEGLGLKNSNMTRLVEKNLRKIHFSGSHGGIAFNEEREVVTEVDIFHVRNGEEMYAGHYTQVTRNITIHLPSERIPGDDFVIRLHLGFSITVLIITAILLVFTLVVLVLFIYYWNKPSIKATSRYQSLLMLAGCCMMYMAAMVVAITEFVTDRFIGPMCQVEICLSAIGVQLIYSTLFMRLLRIYKIFLTSSNLRKLQGKIWSDQGLAALSFIPVSVTIITLILQSALHPLSTGYLIPSFQQRSDTTHLIPLCGGSTATIVWVAVTYCGVNGIPIAGVVILATLTRKVEYDIFKDTKEVNSFVFATVVCHCVSVPYTFTFYNYIQIPQVAFCFVVSPYLVIPFFCKLFLFIPKIWLSKHELHMKEAS